MARFWLFCRRMLAPTVRRFARSALIGAVATGCDLLALHLLVRVAGIPAVAANVPALALGVAVQFFGNKYFAFRPPAAERAREGARDLARQGARFAIVEAGAFALNALGFHLLVTLTAVAVPLARLVTSCAVYVGYSFPMWGFVFRARRATANAVAPAAGA